MTVTKERAMQMFDQDLEILMDDLREMQAHYQIADWEAFVFLRKPDYPESYVVKYAAVDDELARRIVQLHAAPAIPVRDVQCADCLTWFSPDSNHTCRQQVRRNQRSRAK